MRTFMITPTSRRNLYFQTIILVITVPVVIIGMSALLGSHINWSFAALYVALNAVLAIFISLGRSFYYSIAVIRSGAFGLIVGSGIIIFPLSENSIDLGGALLFFGTLGLIALLIAEEINHASYKMVRLVVAPMLGFFTILISIIGISIVTAGFVMGGIVGSLRSFGGVLVFSVIVAMYLTRFPGYVLTAIMSFVSPMSHKHWSRLTWLPVHGFQRELVSWLNLDLAKGMSNISQTMLFTRQFIPVINAINEWLESMPDEIVLIATEVIAEDPVDWELVRFSSASLSLELRKGYREYLTPMDPINPVTLTQQQNADLRFDTASRAASAGFWMLHEVMTTKATQAFAVVRELPNGAQLHSSVEALDSALIGNTLALIADWSNSTSWMSRTPTMEFESIVIKVVRHLREVALEAAVARDSLSRLNRNAALSRAGAMLTNLLEDLDNTYPELVRPVTRRIAAQWRDVLSKAGGEIGQLAIDKPVFNPYVVGPPVTGQLFAGRETILRQLEELWGSDPARPAQSVVLYGHRRMGKTSILLNLGARFGRDTVVVLFTMQRVGRVRDTGELLHALALTIHDALAEAGLPAPDEPDEAAFAGHPYRAFDEFLRAVRAAIGRRRVILTVDEFEAIELAINDGRVEAELLSYLRDVIHKERWLVVAFAGLHTLQEMTGDYWNPLHAGVIPIKVGFFSPATSANLLANPNDDFPLDFTREAAERVYDHVRGQPYLTQLVGHKLVNRYNNERFEQQQAREPRFTAEQVDAVIASAEFYTVGDGYFSGIWSQADDAQAPGQHALLLALARTGSLATIDALAAAAGLSPEASAVALEALERHDVVAGDDEGRIEFTVPLMRRWLQQNKLS